MTVPPPQTSASPSLANPSTKSPYSVQCAVLSFLDHRGGRSQGNKSWCPGTLSSFSPWCVSCQPAILALSAEDAFHLRGWTVLYPSSGRENSSTKIAASRSLHEAMLADPDEARLRMEHRDRHGQGPGQRRNDRNHVRARVHALQFRSVFRV